MSKSQRINFNPDLFNNIFFHIREAWNNVSIRFIWIYGGSSASKTYSVVQQCVIDMLEGRDNNALVLRKYGTDIRDSIYADFKNVISGWGLENQFIIQQNFIKCVTGSYVRFRGLDDSEKVKGIASFKKIILEEVSQFDHEDLKQIRKRLRGKLGQQVIGIFNPISEEHWIKKKIFDDADLVAVECDIAGKWANPSGNILVLKTNYLDNKYIVGPNFVDQHVIDDFEQDKINDPDYYNIYGLGDWGEISKGDSPFAVQFNEQRHVSEVPVYDPKKQLIIAIDFNLTPFCVTFHHFWSDTAGAHCHQFDEAEIKQGSIPAMIEYIKTKYGKSLPNAVLTGDAMGNRGDISQRDNASLYIQLIRGLGMRDRQIQVSSNPTHENSKADVNYFLAHFPDYKVHKSNKGTIRDLKNVQVDIFGQIQKRDRKDVNQRADYLDTVRYLVHNILYKWIDQDQKRRR